MTKGIRLTAICLPLLAFAQPDTLWTSTHESIRHDYLNKIIELPDGSYIASGIRGNPVEGPEDFYLAKFDSAMDIQWERVYDSPGLSLDRCQGLATVPEGGFILAGSRGLYESYIGDGYIVRVDENGDTLWTRIYGMNAHEHLTSVVIAEDGGFICGGVGNGQAWLLKINANGDSLWSRYYGDAVINAIKEMEVLPNGDIVAAASWGTWSTGCLMRLNQNGDTLWTARPSQGICHDFCRTSDGGYAMAGQSFIGNAPYLVKSDSNGVLEWTRSLPLSFSTAYSVCETPDGNIVACGRREIDSQLDMLLFKVDQCGTLYWSTGAGIDGGLAYSVHCPADRRYILVGGAGLSGNYSGICYTQFEADTISTTLIASPSVCEFNELRIGTAETREISLINRVLEATYLSDAVVATNVFQVTEFNPDSLLNLVPASFGVRFSPTAAGNFTDTLFITTSRCDGPFKVPLSGTCVEVQLTSDPMSLDFGEVAVGSTAETPLLILNGSSYSIVMHDVHVDDPFMLELEIPDALSPGESAVASVQFAPWDDSIFNGSIVVYHNGSHTPLEIPVVGNGTMESGEDGLNLPPDYRLQVAYPNPFNASTTLTFDLPQAGRTTLDVFDIMGRNTASLVNDQFPAGTHAIKFDAGEHPSGLYIVRLTSGSFSASRKIVLLR